MRAEGAAGGAGGGGAGVPPASGGLPAGAAEAGAEMERLTRENPELARKMQEEAMQQAAFMQNPEMQQKMQALAEDPEMKPIFDEIRSEGPKAMMKYYNDPEFLKKMAEKLGPIPTAATMPPPRAPEDMPEVENLIDAAKFNDAEAVEDFLDVGKDPNEADGQGRTALHYAAGTGNEEILVLLVEGGADLGAVDAKGNTPLHYAAGYGRPGAARALLEKGASPAVLNGNGKRAVEVARLNSDNPVLKDADLVEKMDAAGFVDQ